jgi:diacylglycerol kinase family enzyme
MKIALVLNGDAGALRTLDAAKTGEELGEILRARRQRVSVEVAAGKAAIEAIRRAFKVQTVDAVVVGGGDGTVSAAAGIAAGSDIALGVLPLGTMNFFAKSLAVPLDMKAAAEALAAGEIATADIATVNGRTFVHALALGLHPRMIAEREKLDYNSRYGKMLGSARAFLRVIRNPRRFGVSIRTDGKTVDRRVAGVVISNNPFGEGHMPYADRLDAGVLGLYLTTAESLPDLARVTAAAAFGKAEASPLIENLTTTTAEIRLGRHKSVPITLDGELVHLPGPLKVEIVAGGLKVLRPRPEPAKSAA